MNCLIKTLSEFEWSCLYEGSANEAIFNIHTYFLKFAKLSILSKTLVVRENDKAWYDSKIRRN